MEFISLKQYAESRGFTKQAVHLWTQKMEDWDPLTFGAQKQWMLTKRDTDKLDAYARENGWELEE